MLSLRTTQRYKRWVFNYVCPQNSAVAISVETGCGIWLDHGGCDNAKQLCVKSVAVR
jgi:hypothetical protein